MAWLAKLGTALLANAAKRGFSPQVRRIGRLAEFRARPPRVVKGWIFGRESGGCNGLLDVRRTRRGYAVVDGSGKSVEVFRRIGRWILCGLTGRW